MTLKLKENWLYSYSFSYGHGFCRIKRTFSIKGCLNITYQIFNIKCLKLCIKNLNVFKMLLQSNL